jgi:predicted 3-demethylubiquinone-9 3-methyltransferase (glyoxalase superfamily)
MQTITPCLWFDNQAEEAANFYVSVFPNSEVLAVSRYPEGGQLPAGTALAVDFTLNGIGYRALNGGPGHPFTDAISLAVNAPIQPEIDRLWDLLPSNGGHPGPCGWLTDRFGVSWQVAPPVLSELMNDPDPAVASRVMRAMMNMGKIEIADLKAAAQAT